MPPRNALQSLEAYEAIKDHGSVREAARALDLPESTVRSRAKSHGDPWPAIPGKSIMYGPDGETKLVWSKGGKPTDITIQDVEEAFERALQKGVKKAPAIKPATNVNDDLLGIWPLADLHVGMRAWGAETGGPDWDIGIATAAYQEGLTEITAMTPKVKHGVVLVAGDLTHADTLDYKTTNPATHHVVDCDGRYQKMVEASVEIVEYAIQCAGQKAETVDVVVLPGNHDGLTAINVKLILAAKFENSKQISVNKSPSRYWWYEWGRCMFACTHGDKNNIKRLPGYMADHMHEMWGRCKHRYAFTGHLHQKLVEQCAGVRVEILPTPVAPDSFSSEYGYSSPRMFETKVYHKDRGLRCTPSVIL